MSRARRGSAMLAALVGAWAMSLGCGSPSPAVVLTGSAARALLAEPARLSVFFWPAHGQCSTVELSLIATIEQFIERFPDTRAVSVVPDDFPGSQRYGAELPGKLVRLPRAEFEREAALSSFPRIEVWDQDNHLLLFRVVSGLSSEAETVATELERARALTRPLEATAAVAAEEMK